MYRTRTVDLRIILNVNLSQLQEVTHYYITTILQYIWSFFKILPLIWLWIKNVLIKGPEDVFSQSASYYEWLISTLIFFFAKVRKVLVISHERGLYLFSFCSLLTGLKQAGLSWKKCDVMYFCEAIRIHQHVNLMTVGWLSGPWQ